VAPRRGRHPYYTGHPTIGPSNPPHIPLSIHRGPGTLPSWTCRRLQRRNATADGAVSSSLRRAVNGLGGESIDYSRWSRCRHWIRSRTAIAMKMFVTWRGSRYRIKMSTSISCNDTTRSSSHVTFTRACHYYDTGSTAHHRSRAYIGMSER